MKTFEIEYDSKGRRYTIKIDAWDYDQAVEIFNLEHCPAGGEFTSCTEI